MQPKPQKEKMGTRKGRLRLKAKTGLSLSVLLGFAGIPERTWREWQERKGLETRHNSNIPRG